MLDKPHLTHPLIKDPKTCEKMMMSIALAAMYNVHENKCESTKGAVTIVVSPSVRKAVMSNKAFAAGALNIYAFSPNLVKHTGAKTKFDTYIDVKHPTMEMMTFKLGNHAAPSESHPLQMVSAYLCAKSVHPFLTPMKLRTHVEKLFGVEVSIPCLTNGKKIAKGDLIQVPVSP